jgi:hypothetical protein
MENLANILDKFGKGIRKQARANLTRQGKNVDKNLWKSINYGGKVNPNSFEFQVGMNEYGEYQDQGVKGAKSTYPSSSDSPYKYTNKRPPISPIADWAKKKNIRLRDEAGRFAKGNYKTIGFIISRSIYRKGIPASFFLTKSIDSNLKRLPPEMVEAYQLDLLKAIKRFTDIRQ